MNYLKKILKGIAILTVTGLMLTSCETDSIDLNEEASELNIATAITQTEIDDVSEEINDLGESVYVMYGNATVSKYSYTKKQLSDMNIPECLTITKVITFNSVNLTLDFGDGCLNHNDNYLSGKIIMSIAFDLSEKSISIDYTFDNFYFNGKHVEGEMKKTKIRMNGTGNPVVTIIKDLKITWKNGEFVTIKGERQREWIEGFGNKVWGDNIFSITGNWIITNRKGITKTAKIIEPLIRKAACRFIVSGIVEISRKNTIVNLDYGNGECDNLAMASSNGKEREIQLGKRKK